MLVGRERELEAVHAVCRHAAAGHGSVLVVSGEPGIGKTALLGSLDAGEPAWTLLQTTGVEPESTVAFAALQSLLWPLRDGLGELESGQARLLAGVLALGPPAAATSFAVGAATLALLSLASSDRAIVAVADDAHWADPASQEVLCFVGRRLRHEHIAILAAVRTGEPCLLTDERSFDRLELEGLDADAARALLERIWSTGLAAEVGARLLDACAGNPLGLVELPRSLTELQRRGDEALPHALGAGPHVQRAFAAEVSRLSSDDQRALLLLAAAGETDPAVLGRSGVSDATLNVLTAGGLLVHRRAGLEFRHPLVRSAVYGAATPGERREAHRMLAEATSGARRAWHLAGAAEGPDEPAAAALEETAAEARAAGGLVSQAQALERAADLSADPDRRALRLLGAARALRLAGRIEHARELLATAIAVVQDGRARAEIQLEHGSNLLRERAFRDAYETLLAEARRAEKSAPDLAARLFAAVALVANVYPEAPPALGPAERALALAGGRGDEVELEALFAVISARMCRPCPPDDGDEALVHRAVTLLERPELRAGEQPHWIAYALAELEHDEEARSLSDVALGEARAAGDVWSLCYGLYARAALELVGGSVDAARSWVAEALPLAEQIGERWRLEEAHAVRAEVDSARGIVAAEQAGHLDESHTQFSPDEMLNRGRALLACGHDDEAIPLLEVAAGAFSETTPRGWYRLVPLDLAEACVGAKRAKEAEAVLRTAAPAIEGCRLVRPRARLARVRALLAPDAKIDAAFAAALDVLAETPQRLERARIELCWGERLRRAGRSDDAVAHLEHALARFVALSAVGWAERARAELEAATGTTRPAQPRRTDVLTAQELRVSRHAAEGMRDREIAALLYLSPRTVESYLQSAYRKLGVSNRTQLAGVLASDAIGPVGPITAAMPKVP